MNTPAHLNGTLPARAELAPRPRSLPGPRSDADDRAFARRTIGYGGFIPRRLLCVLGPRGNTLLVPRDFPARR
jgi:hypothetical protein